MLMCWKRYASERPHFAQIVDVIASFLEHVNNKRDSYYFVHFFIYSSILLVL